MVLTEKYYGGKVPAFDESEEIIGPEDQYEGSYHDSELLRLFDDSHELCDAIRRFDFRAGLKTLMDISTKGNQILQFNEPWKNIKDQPEMVKAVMNLCLQYVAALGVLCRPFMPFTSDKIRQLLNQKPIEEKGELEKILNELAEGNCLLKKGHRIGAPLHLFTRIDDATIEKQIEKLHATAVSEGTAVVSETHIAPMKEEVTYEDFARMDIRTATIVQEEKVEKADKLLKLTLSLGSEQRTVLSGIAQHYTPEDIIGKQVCLLANLAPRTMRGIESQGMILMAENSEGKLSFVSPAPGWENGQIVK